MSRASVKASTSPSTPSAPTTCKSPPGRGLPGGRAHNYGLGHIPGNVPTVEGLQRKLEPLSFCPAGAEEKDCHSRRPAQKYRPQQITNREVVMRLEGGCYCGEVRYVAEGDPMMQAQCH